MLNWTWKEKLERLWRSRFQGLNLHTNEKLAIDMGAANTRIYLPENGVVINEASMIALDTMKGKVTAVGEEAKRLVRRRPRQIRVLRPIMDGVIADCDAAGQLLAQFINRALMHRRLTGLSLLICIPGDITPLEQKAYEEAARRAGARKVTLIEEPFAVAIGADFNLRAACAYMIADLGAATTDVAVICGGALIHASTRRVGGNEMDRAILRHLQLERALEVNEETAEEIKIKLGGVDMRSDRPSMPVRGRNLRTGLPEEIIVTSEEIHPLIQPALRVIKQHLRTALEEIPTGALVDLLDSGITLSGGLAQLPGLTEHLNQDLGLRMRVVPDPMLAAVLGAGRLLEQSPQTLTEEMMKEQESAGC
ncbi:MAG TPA: rod shape-determining protein [Blastocatellia bacterium]|nr:rod shape-determining protein [Blastocatellia bacterium]